MEDRSQAPITEQEALQAIGQLVSIETKADFIKALERLNEFSSKLLGQVDAMGDILQANAIAEAKSNSEKLQAKAKEISDRHPFQPYNKVAVSFEQDGKLGAPQILE
jgi:hypothetical protein